LNSDGEQKPVSIGVYRPPGFHSEIEYMFQLADDEIPSETPGGFLSVKTEIPPRLRRIS